MADNETTQAAKAAEREAIQRRDRTKFGLAKYSELNYVGWSDFDTEADRNAAAAEYVNKNPYGRVQLFQPSPEVPPTPIAAIHQYNPADGTTTIINP